LSQQTSIQVLVHFMGENVFSTSHRTRYESTWLFIMRTRDVVVVASAFFAAAIFATAHDHVKGVCSFVVFCGSADILVFRVSIVAIR
jgi:hypothetical protein